MTNREIVEKVVAAFDMSDAEGILQYMADDVQWYMLAERKVFDKAAMSKLFAENPVEITYITKENFIVDGNAVSVNGDVTCKDLNTGIEYKMHYCDIYELENGKVKKMTTYSIERK